MTIDELSQNAQSFTKLQLIELFQLSEKEFQKAHREKLFGQPYRIPGIKENCFKIKNIFELTERLRRVKNFPPTEIQLEARRALEAADNGRGYVIDRLLELAAA